ncbi:hypothetical protein Kpol_543p11 [Vanderwaltozyma polyspora DSM 70294]|uniref:Thiamine pyrophosphokinase n=1 Tax=Vanderwaltozyma polyspora (strain ATCC 22028 / DSM 70294 / BCRC 21397 / CBS 2163 / NBRC 10782 / NRRL Y-8283 / UCD 57-17) TaxID=436907 RepID=A7THL6_VANPO|nr:uncharacterized protein Kpol_543p11 [Vanderwaltozyma polyspora DSM 70294]EDO18182.1 hypothetical protein Kpol_543p11 [Vanderwaltozyma polyspora DSM 70294]
MSETCVENDDRFEVNCDGINIIRTLSVESMLKPVSTVDSALLILNQEIAIGPLFLKLWSQYDLIVCADGGANRLFNYFKEDELQRQKYIPDYIIGDFDSLDLDVKHYYQNAGVVTIKQSSQYSTDFTKCAHLISLHFNLPDFKLMLKSSDVSENHGIEGEKGIHTLYYQMKEQHDSKQFNKISLLALGGIDGRFDQTIHSITQFYTLEKSDPYIDLYYLTPTDIIFMVQAGGILLTYPTLFRDTCIGNCGVLPIAAPSEIIESRGLKWDVSNWKTSITTGQVSSSNRFAGFNKCYINVKENVIMNIEIKLQNLTNNI